MILAVGALKVDEDGVGPGDNVIVGHDVAVGGNDEARAKGTLRAGPGAALAFKLLEETFKFRRQAAEHFRGQAAPLHDFFLGADVDDGFSGRLDEGDEVRDDDLGLSRKRERHDQHGGNKRPSFQCMQHVQSPLVQRYGQSHENCFFHNSHTQRLVNTLIRYKVLYRAAGRAS